VEWIVPRDAAFNTPVAATGNHLDVVGAIAGNGSSYVEITDGSGADLLMPTTGNEGALLTNGAPGNLLLNRALPVNMILRRRAHPTRARPTAMNTAQEEDNPWVEVDRASIAGNEMPVFNYPDSGNDATGQLASLQSWQRDEPLFRGSLASDSPTPDRPSTGNMSNTFSAGAAAENQNAPMTFTLYQTHFDREFTSLGDLLHLPVVGPPAGDTTAAAAFGLTSYTAAMRLPPEAQYDSPESLGTYYQNFAKSAAGMFMVPDHPTAGTVGTIDVEDNRWHRVLEFLEVPTRQHRNLGIGTEFEVTRVPGKINLNTLRHPEVLAALIDNELILDFDPSNNSMNEPKVRNLTDTSDNPDWFEQLQNSRDPRDPFWQTQGQDLRLPGLANSTTGTDPKGHPFRSLAFNNANANSIQHTLLRDMPVDNETGGRTQQRALFEVGTHGEHETNPESINPTLRYQVLSKLWNNTTVRSNSFVVFASVKLFRASVDGTTGAVRIGGPLKEFATGTEERPELPEYRGVFVVDRSLIEKGVSTGGAGFTNFRPFVTHRRILKEE
ncbi:MAG: hypothetical protein SFV23_13700, partial [Planctomycetaceae bacterium]|nr:hypothetical protein [Planctomycetaceae bacterium]